MLALHPTSQAPPPDGPRPPTRSSKTPHPMRGEVKHVVTGGLTGGQTGDVTGGSKICNSFINSPFRQLTGGVGAILNKHHANIKRKVFPCRVW